MLYIAINELSGARLSHYFSHETGTCHIICCTLFYSRSYPKPSFAFKYTFRRRRKYVEMGVSYNNYLHIT